MFDKGDEPHCPHFNETVVPIDIDSLREGAATATATAGSSSEKDLQKSPPDVDLEDVEFIQGLRKRKYNLHFLFGRKAMS